MQTYIGHGGKILNKSPYIYEGGKNEDLAEMVTQTRKGVGNQGESL